MMKIEKDLEKLKDNPNINDIVIHLIALSTQDSGIKEDISRDDKSLDDMYSYVSKEAKKQAYKGCAKIRDEEVYGWAIHYYHESNESLGIVNKAPKKAEPKKEEVILPEEKLEDFDI